MKINWPFLRRQNMFKFALLVVLKLVAFPLQVLFYVVRSAWYDSAEVGRWFRPRAICPHSIDRNREPCDECDFIDNAKIQAAIDEHMAGEQEHGPSQN